MLVSLTGIVIVLAMLVTEIGSLFSTVRDRTADLLLARQALSQLS